MSSRQPLRIPRQEEHNAFGGRRLEHVLGYASKSSDRISALADTLDLPAMGEGARSHTAMYVDATSRTPVYVSDGMTAVHILWTAPGQRAEILAGADPVGGTDLIGWGAHPGDTITVEECTPFALGAGIIAFVFGSAPLRSATDPATWSRSPLPIPPTHGLNLFDRYNRRTICAANRDFLLERWKISQPLRLTLNRDRWHYLTNLAAPVAWNWPEGSELLQRVESRLLPQGLDRITIVPDGLGYVLIGSVPDLETDVVLPLRRAGYDRAAIASLGVPPDLLP